MADWYYARGGTHQGPITSAQLRQMAQSGELKPDDLVFQEGGTQWVPASTVKGLFSPPGGGSASTPNRSGVSSRAEAVREADVEPAPVAAKESPASGGKSNYWLDLLMFRRMIAPLIIQALFWIFSVVVIIGSLVGLLGGVIQLFGKEPLIGLGTMVLSLLYLPFGLLSVRLYCELMILFFRMNESLSDIKDTLSREKDRS